MVMLYLSTHMHNPTPTQCNVIYTGDINNITHHEYKKVLRHIIILLYMHKCKNCDDYRLN